MYVSDLDDVILRPPSAADFDHLVEAYYQLEWFTCPNALKLFLDPTFADGHRVADFKGEVIGKGQCQLSTNLAPTPPSLPF